MEVVFVILAIWFIYRWRKRRRSSSASTQMTASNLTHRIENVSVGNSNGSEGWYRDPTSRYQLRYWDGAAWSEHVTTGDGSTRRDQIITRIGMNGAPNISNARPIPSEPYEPPAAGTQQDGPDLNDLRRRFNL